MLIIFAKLSVSYFSTYTLLSLIINMRCHTLQFNMDKPLVKIILSPTDHTGNLQSTCILSFVEVFPM